MTQLKRPKGVYCYDNNGLCPYYKQLGSIKYNREPQNDELLCIYDCNLYPNRCRGCESKVIHCDYLDYTDFDQDTLLWDRVKECNSKIITHKNNIIADNYYQLIERKPYQDAFVSMLESWGLDSYGHVSDMSIEDEKKYIHILDSKTNKGMHLHYFDNGIFMINPYYWGDAYDLLNFPNFKYYPTGLEMTWYKYPLRSCALSQELTEDEFYEIIEDCKKK